MVRLDHFLWHYVNAYIQSYINFVQFYNYHFMITKNENILIEYIFRILKNKILLLIKEDKYILYDIFLKF